MIQMLAQWNGLEAFNVYSLSAPEETRLIGLRLARAFTPGMDGSSTPAAPISVTASRTATAGDDGATLVFTGAFTITVPAGMPPGFGFAAVPPASGNASIATSGTTLNGAATTVTRTLVSNAVFAVVQKSANAYIVTGS